jgi:hypothetical protein
VDLAGVATDLRGDVVLEDLAELGTGERAVAEPAGSWLCQTSV